MDFLGCPDQWRRLAVNRALKVYVEALGRGVPAYVQKDALPPGPADQAPIHPQSLMGLGLSFHPHARVDLGVSVQRGFGGLAPWAVSVQFLTFSVGKTYDHRAATPVVQMAADVTVESVRVIHAYIKSLPIDPVLDNRCMLWDDNGDLMVQQPLGTRTADGKHCMVEGEKLAIGERWWRDRKKSVICHDKKLTDCLMYRRPHEHSYRVLHRPWVGDDCVLRENVYDPSAPSIEKGQTHRTVELALIGSLTKDKKGCTNPAGSVYPIGTQYYREHGHLWVCDAPRIEEQRDRCSLSLAELPQKMQNQTTPVGRIARALDHGLSKKAQAIDKISDQVVNTADGVADGRITAGTVAGALEAKAKDIVQHASLDAAKSWIKSKIDDAREWAGKPLIEQGEDLAEEAGDAMIPHPVTVGMTVVTGGFGRGALHAAAELEDAAKVGKKAANAAASAAIKAEKKTVMAVGAAAEANAARAGAAIIEEGKLGYLLGQASGRAHNVERALENAGQLARIEVHDSTAGRALLRSHLQRVASDASNVVRTFSNQYGNFVIKESLLAGLHGFVKFESTWQVLIGDGLRLITAIPFGG